MYLRNNENISYFDFCVAYTKCVAALCYDLIYLFIYLSTRVESLSRGLRRNCTLGSSNFFKWSCQEFLVRHKPGFTWFNWVRVLFSGDGSITRVGSPRTSQQKQTQLRLSLSSSNTFLAIVSRVSRTRQQTQTRLGLSLSSINFFR